MSLRKLLETLRGNMKLDVTNQKKRFNLIFKLWSFSILSLTKIWNQWSTFVWSMLFLKTKTPLPTGKENPFEGSQSTPHDKVHRKRIAPQRCALSISFLLLPIESRKGGSFTVKLKGVKTIKFTFLWSTNLLGEKETFLIKSFSWFSIFSLPFPLVPKLSGRSLHTHKATTVAWEKIHSKWFAAYCLQLSNAFSST